jgi:hypothetical protein
MTGCSGRQKGIGQKGATHWQASVKSETLKTPIFFSRTLCLGRSREGLLLWISRGTRAYADTEEVTQRSSARPGFR